MCLDKIIFLSWVDFYAATYVLSDNGKLCSDLSNAEPVGKGDCEGPAAIAALKTIIPSLTKFNDHTARSSGVPKNCWYGNRNDLYWNWGAYHPKFGRYGCGEGIIAGTDCPSNYRQICKKKGKYQHYKNQLLIQHDQYLSIKHRL